jgi:uncharacterized protein (TIGR02001 family)
MKPCSRALLASSLAACSALASAQEEAPSPFSANVTLATDYIFRGISQTDENFAIQGGFDYKHPVGFWAGIWASNVDFNVDENIEIDLYAGFSKVLQNGLGFDAAVYRYTYPNSHPDGFDYDYTEVMVGGSYKWLNIKYWYSYDYFAESGNSGYIEGNMDVPLPMDFGLGLHVGYQYIDDNDRFGTPDYTDWKVSLSKEVAGIGLTLSYVDTNLDEDECFGSTTLCDSRAGFSISKSF